MYRGRRNTKQIWLRVAAVCMIAAAAAIALGELLPLLLLVIFSMKPQAGADLGVIGGADGPTAIFVTGPNWPGFAVHVFLAAVLLTVGIILLKKAKR